MGLESCGSFGYRVNNITHNKGSQDPSSWLSVELTGFSDSLVLSTMQRQKGKSPPGQFCQGLTPEFAHSIRP